MIVSKQEFLDHSGVHAQMLEFWIEQRWLIPQESPEGARFSERDIARARLIQDLKGDMGVNDEGVDAILHLIDQLHGLRGALAQVREIQRGSV